MNEVNVILFVVEGVHFCVYQNFGRIDWYELLGIKLVIITQIFDIVKFKGYRTHMVVI